MKSLQPPFYFFNQVLTEFSVSGQMPLKVAIGFTRLKILMNIIKK